MSKSQVWVAALQSSMKDMTTDLQSIHASLYRCDDRNETSVHVAALKEKFEKYAEFLDTHAAHSLHVSTRLAASEAETELATESENETDHHTGKPTKRHQCIEIELKDIKNRLEDFEDVYSRDVAATTGKLDGRIVALEDKHLVHVTSIRERVTYLESLDGTLAARIDALEKLHAIAQVARINARVVTLEIREANSTGRITALENNHSAAQIADSCASIASLEAGNASMKAKQDTSLDVAAAAHYTNPIISHTEEPKDPLAAVDSNVLTGSEIDNMSG